jgi:hypothetical protein
MFESKCKRKRREIFSQRRQARKEKQIIRVKSRDLKMFFASFALLRETPFDSLVPACPGRDHDAKLEDGVSWEPLVVDKSHLAPPLEGEELDMRTVALLKPSRK